MSHVIVNGHRLPLVGTSTTAGGATFAKVQDPHGLFLWLKPDEWEPACPAPYCVFEVGHPGPHDVVVGRWAA